MADSIVPSTPVAGRALHQAFPAEAPQLHNLDAGLGQLLDLYTRYLADTADTNWTPAELAKELTMRALGDEDAWDFWGWVARKGDKVKSPSSPAPQALRFEGFHPDAEWCINRWAVYSATQGSPMTPGDVVRTLTFMVIDADEDFRAWRIKDASR